MLDYLSPGQSLAASHWQALWAEADARLSDRFGGLAAFLLEGVLDQVGQSFLYDRTFLFVSAVAPSVPATIAQSATSTWAPGPARVLYKRAYSDAVFLAWVAAATVDSSGPAPYKEDWPPFFGRAGGVVRLVAPTSGDWPALSAAIWPEGVFGGSIDAFGDLLSYSLRVHTFTIDGVDYNVYPAGAAQAEFVHWWDAAEIVLGDGVGATFSWLAAYDKFRLLRFSNLQPLAVTISLPELADWSSSGTHDVVVPAMESVCVRMSGYGPSRGWVVGGRYFHRALPLDPWWLARGHGCNLTDPLNCATFLPCLDLAPAGDDAPWYRKSGFTQMDASAFWDVSAIYNGAAAVGRGCYAAAPAGGWFAAVDRASLIGDFMFHRGKLLAVQPGSDFRVARVPAQALTFSIDGQVLTLSRADNAPAMSVADVTVKRVSDSADIPAGSGADTNWVATLNSPPTPSTVQFSVRSSGASPRLSLDDQLLVSFTYISPDNRLVFDYTGIGNLAADLSAIGATVTAVDLGLGLGSIFIQVAAASEIYLASLSSNLVTQVWGYPAIDLLTFPGYIGLFSLTGHLLKATAFVDSVTGTYQPWTFDATTGPYSVAPSGDPVTVSASSCLFYTADAVAVGPWAMTASLGTVLDDVAAADGSSVTRSASFLSTVYGPGLVITESISALFPFLDGSGSPCLPARSLLDAARWQFNSGAGTFEKRSWYPLTIFQNDGGEVELHWPCYGGVFENQDSFGPMRVPDLARHFPRIERGVARMRMFDPAANVLGLDKRSVPPFFLEWFESAPYAENHPVALSSFPAVGVGTEVIPAPGVSFLGKFYGQIPQVWLRLAAWIRYGQVFRCPDSGDFVEDFVSGGAPQSGYWASAQTAMTSPTGSAVAPGDDDRNPGGGHTGSGLAAVEALPMAVEHWNAAASAINASDKFLRGAVRTRAHAALLGLLEAQIGFGFGAAVYRPRTQFAGWYDSGAGDGHDLTVWAGAMGLTVLSASDFPASWATFSAAKSLAWNTDATSTTEGAAGSLRAEWLRYIFGGPSDDDGGSLAACESVISGYRWVTISDAQALYAALDAPFIMQELAAPGTLAVEDAGQNLIAVLPNPWIGGGGGWTARAAGFWNDASGDWLYNPDGGLILRASVARTDYCLLAPVSYSTYYLTFSHLDQRFYDLGALGVGCPVGVSQQVVGNSSILCRRFGSGPVLAVVWPRNYCDWSRNTGTAIGPACARLLLGWSSVPRVAVTTLEGTSPETTDCSADETVLTTALENALLVAWPLSKT
jgi:hypothetical protein